MDTFINFMGILFMCVLALIALTIVMFMIVRRMPDSNPFKKVFRAVTRRVGATALVALVGLPIQPIPEVDGVYDITGLIVLAIYWYGLIAKIRSSKNLSEAKPHLGTAAKILGQMARHAKNMRG